MADRRKLNLNLISPKFKENLNLDQDNASAFPPINPPFKRPESPTADNQTKESYFPEFMSRPEMAPQIAPSKFADC